MKRLKMTVAYDGTEFAGFQRQPGKRTVQGVLEDVLTRLTENDVQITGAGRTDSGVHALGQVIHFDTSCPIPIDRWVRVLHHTLPCDLLVTKAEEVSTDFHSRKSACWKRYRYTLDTGKLPDLFQRRFRTHYPYRLDCARMNEAARHLLGTHDFTSLSAAKAQVKDRVRTLYHCEVQEKDSRIVMIEVVGSGFLYHMVRIIAGTLVDIGVGKTAPGDLPGILSAKDRSAAGKTFPPEGLTMMEVGYTPWFIS